MAREESVTELRNASEVEVGPNRASASEGGVSTLGEVLRHPVPSEANGIPGILGFVATHFLAVLMPILVLFALIGFSDASGMGIFGLAAVLTGYSGFVLWRARSRSSARSSLPEEGGGDPHDTLDGVADYPTDFMLALVMGIVVWLLIPAIPLYLEAGMPARGIVLLIEAVLAGGAGVATLREGVLRLRMHMKATRAIEKWEPGQLLGAVSQAGSDLGSEPDPLTDVGGGLKRS